jgi:hypothetical protein
MTNATAAQTVTAAQILVAAQAAKARRLEAERVNGPYDWSDTDALADFIAMIETVRFWKAGPRKVTVTVANTPAGRLWSYTACEILDSAAGQFDLGDDARIDQLSATVHQLSW